MSLDAIESGLKIITVISLIWGAVEVLNIIVNRIKRARYERMLRL